jgi:flagellar protein FliS
MNHQVALEQHKQIRANVQTEGASPRRLVQVLPDGAIERIRGAKAAMDRGDIPEKVRHIDWALSIIDGLRQSLAMERGGEIASNLEALYDYMQRRLIVANAQNAPSLLIEVLGLIQEIKSAWDAVPDIFNKDNQGTTAELG